MLMRSSLGTCIENAIKMTFVKKKGVHHQQSCLAVLQCETKLIKCRSLDQQGSCILHIFLFNLATTCRLAWHVLV